nr:integrase arm-type DNA-binding domain-containing protein [uncultured Roseococcus sp.]
MATASGKIGLREIRAIAPGSELFDGPGGLPGFGTRRRAGPAVSYFVMFRTAEGRQRRFTIGTHGAPWTPEEARAKAKALLAEVVKGEDPSARKREVREAPTVAELCTSYLEAAEAGRLPTRRGGTKKASTIATDRSRIDSHILPLLGSMKVRAVTQRDLDDFLQDVAPGKTHRREHLGRSRAYRNVRGGMGTASRTMGLLGAIFTYALRMGLRDDNPTQGVLRPADSKRERRLSADE